MTDKQLNTTYITEIKMGIGNLVVSLLQEYSKADYSREDAVKEVSEWLEKDVLQIINMKANKNND